MKNYLTRYILYIITVGPMYALFRISDFSSTQTQALALVTVFLGSFIFESRYSQKK